MADDAMSRFKRLVTGAQQTWEDHADAVADEEKLSAPEAFVHFWVLTVRSFVRNRVPVRAAALAYSSLLALVPMLALVLTIGLGFLRGTDRWHARIILGLLDECDSVKWAHYAPDANRAQRALTMAYEIVELVNADVAPTPGATPVGAKTA